MLNNIDPDVNCVRSDINCVYVDTNNAKNYINISKNDLSVLSFNVRSFFKNIDEFIGLLASLDLSSDIIVLSETWLNSHTESLCNIDGYQAYHSYRANKEGGGVSIFIKNHINSHVTFSCNDPGLECVIAQIKVNKHHLVNIVGVYRPPGGDIPMFTQLFDNIMIANGIGKTDSIIMGDFNICLLKGESNNATLQFINMMHSLNFYPQINKPTRIVDDSMSLIDHIWVNTYRPCFTSIITSHITDHYPVMTVIQNIFQVEKEMVTIKFRDFSNQNIIKFKRLLSVVDWSVLPFVSNNSNELISIFF